MPARKIAVAAIIAVAVAVSAPLSHRNSGHSCMDSGGAFGRMWALIQLGREILDQGQRVKDSRYEVSRVRERDGIDDPDPENTNTTITTCVSGVMPKEHQVAYSAAKARYLAEQKIFEAGKKKWVQELLAR